MKNIYYIIFFFLISCSTPSLDSSKNGQEQSRDSVLTNIGKDTTELKSISSIDSTKEQIEEFYIEESKRIVINEKYKALKKLMIKDKYSELEKHIKFPLDARSADAFGCEAESIDKQFTRKQFINNYKIFFTDVLIDSLETDAEIFEIYQKEGEIKWLIRANTFDPPNKDREWGLECSYQIYGIFENSDLIITGFGSLCGGIL